MNIRLSILLVMVLLLFGGTILVVGFPGKKERQPDEPWLYRIDESAIVRIEVTVGSKTAVYKRDPGGLIWYIQGDPQIPVFIDKWGGTPLLLSGPRVNRLLADTIDNLASYGLDPPESVVKVADRSGQSFEFHMGIPTPDDSNQYARLVGHPALFTVPRIWAQVVNRLALEPPYLRLYQLEDDALVFFEVTDSGQTIGYGRKRDGKWYVLDPTEVPVLTEKWGDTPALLSGPRVDQLIAEEIENPADYGLDPPRTTVKVGPQIGAQLEFHLGDVTPDGDHRYARLVGEPRLFAMPNLRAKRITDLATAPPYGQKEEATPEPG